MLSRLGGELTGWFYAGVVPRVCTYAYAMPRALRVRSTERRAQAHLISVLYLAGVSLPARSCVYRKSTCCAADQMPADQSACRTLLVGPRSSAASFCSELARNMHSHANRTRRAWRAHGDPMLRRRQERVPSLCTILVCAVCCPCRRLVGCQRPICYVR